MTATYLPGLSGHYMPRPQAFADSNTLVSLATLNTDGYKCGMMGQVWWPDRASHNIRKIHFRTNTCSVNAASVIRVSLQDLHATTGNPVRPDGTQDQTADILGSAIVSAGWNTTGNLSADRTTAHGAFLAVVWEFGSGGFTAADSVIIAAPRSDVNSGQFSNFPIGLRDHGGGWATSSRASVNVIFEADDGTFGTFFGADIVSALNTLSFNSGSTPDEQGNEFALATPHPAIGVWAYLAAAGDFELVLYEGTTARATLAVDKEYAGSSSAIGFHEFMFATPYQLAASTTYTIAIKPTSGSNVIIGYVDVNAAGHRAIRSAGDQFNLNTRTNAGAWGTASTTRRLRMGLILGGADNGAGGAGFIPVKARKH